MSVNAAIGNVEAFNEILHLAIFNAIESGCGRPSGSGSGSLSVKGPVGQQNPFAQQVGVGRRSDSSV
jgi:hypothetical protein